MSGNAQHSTNQAHALPVGEVPEWVMIARAGRWEGHPAGLEQIDTEHLRSALDYFRRHYAAHGAELPIDYHHASLAVPGAAPKAPAAGWIHHMELRAGGTELWGRVLWTTDAWRDISARRFRYLSPVFRFNARDRVSGERVPLQIPSVALTNTPFLTELQALNQNAAPEGGGITGPPEPPAKASHSEQGGESMGVIEALAQALGKEPEETASSLGLDPEAEEKDAAEAIMANAQRAREMGERLAAQREVVNALGVPPEAGADQIRHAFYSWKASALAPVLGAVRERLGLAEDSDEQVVLNALDAVMEDGTSRRATGLVAEAIEAGRVPPSQREFFLACARDDLEATRRCLNALAPMMAAPQSNTALKGAGGRRELDEAERSVCRQLALAQESYLRAAD